MKFPLSKFQLSNLLISNWKLFLFTFALFIILNSLLTAPTARATDPLPTPYVPCDQTRTPEFHSDRPYQASPCKEPPGTPPKEPLALLCGNDLVFKETFEVKPKDSNSCQDIGDIRRCTYTPESTINASIDLTKAELPIAGNTESVPNLTNSQNQLENADRVNQYVAWYLNGTPSLAEEENRPTFPTITDEYIYNLVNFSGPIRKLMSWDSQAYQRIKVITEEANKNQHNQIVGCSIGLLGNIAFPANCLKDKGRADFFSRRLTDWLSHLPPLRDKYFDFRTYWTEFKRWLGSECVSLPFGLIYCRNLKFENFWANLWQQVPFTSREDKKGEVEFFADNFNKGETPKVVQQPADSSTKITSLNFKPTKGQNIVNYTSKQVGIVKYVFFPHMVENAQLGEFLQKTYVPKDEKAVDLKGENGNPFNTNRCEILDARTNKGDDIFGEYNENKEGNIRGSVSYTTNFTCDYNLADLRSCQNKCGPDCRKSLNQSSCVKSCMQSCEDTILRCDRDVTVAVGSVYTRLPRGEEVWKRLVEGEFSIFKRIFPKIAPGSPVEKIIDIPAVTGASYSVSKESGPENKKLEALAGNPSANRPGDQAQLFIPHLGAVSEYFLKGIQKALRPKDYADPIVAQGEGVTVPLTPFVPRTSRALQPPDPNADEKAAAEDPVFAASGSCTNRSCTKFTGGTHIDGWPAPLQKAFKDASAKYGIPECVLTAIANIEGSKMKLLTDSEASFLTQEWGSDGESQLRQKYRANGSSLYTYVNCNPNYLGYRGPMQIGPGEFASFGNASGSPHPSICNARDAIFTSAKFLVEGRLPYYGYAKGSDWSDPRKYCAAGQTYYGSCLLDAPTCNNLGTNYCDFVRMHCGADLPSGTKTCGEIINKSIPYKGDNCYLPSSTR